MIDKPEAQIAKLEIAMFVEKWAPAGEDALQFRNDLSALILAIGRGTVETLDAVFKRQNG